MFHYELEPGPETGHVATIVFISKAKDDNGLPRFLDAHMQYMTPAMVEGLERRSPRILAALESVVLDYIAAKSSVIQWELCIVSVAMPLQSKIVTSVYTDFPPPATGIGSALRN